MNLAKDSLLEIEPPGADPHARVVWEGPRSNLSPYPDSDCYPETRVSVNFMVLKKSWRALVYGASGSMSTIGSNSRPTRDRATP